MLSERKTFLRISEITAVVGVIVSWYVALQNYRHPDPEFPALLAFVAGMALLMVPFLPVCILGTEYNRSKPQPATFRWSDVFLFSDIRAMSRRAPTVYKLAGLLAVVIAVVVGTRFGTITFTDSKPPDPEEVVGLALYFSAFFLLTLPILGAASRMRGTYADGDA